MAKLIKTNGSVINVEPKNGTDFQLKELQGFVGGYIEIVYLVDGNIMVVNEEGWISGTPILNVLATEIVGEPIAGDVLICKDSEVK